MAWAMDAISKVDFNRQKQKLSPPQATQLLWNFNGMPGMPGNSRFDKKSASNFHLLLKPGALLPEPPSLPHPCSWCRQ